MTRDVAAAAGWTGAHYSVVRGLVGLALAIVLATRLPVADGGPQAVVGMLAAVLFAIGLRDRWMALVLLAVVLAETSGAGGLVGPIGLAGFFALHSTVPAAPYGSLDARGRIDPGGGWALSPRFVHRAWRLLGAIALLRAWQLVGMGSSGAMALGVTTALGGLVALRGRPDAGLWLLLATLLVVASPLAASPLSLLASLAALAVAATPSWLPPDDRAAPLLLFYDGHCGLCHRTVRLVLAEDRTAAFRFAPLGGPTFLARVPPERRAGLPDSMVLETRDGSILTRARGAIEAGRSLGGGWRLLGALLALMPGALLDRAYDAVAASRRRLFRPPGDVCPIVPDGLRGRFPDLAP